MQETPQLLEEIEGFPAPEVPAVDTCGMTSLNLSLCCAGQLLAMKISQRTVALSGGMLFLLFAGHNLIYGSAT